MKLGKIKKGLAILMGIMAVCPMVYAQDTEIKEIASTITTEAEEAVEEEDELYPYFIGEEIIELIKKEGTAINQSQTHGNVKVTLHSIWADAHNYKLLLSAEHVDKTPFKESVNVQFEGRREVLSKEDYEKEQVLANIPEDATTEERLKIHATVDEWYKQFIKADGSVDMEAYIEKITEAVEAEHANIITGGTASGGFGESYTVPTNNYEKYFIMTGSNIMETLTDALVIELGTYKEVEWNRYVSPLDLVAYLEAHKKDILKTVPNTFSESEKSYLEKLKSIDPEAYEVEYKEVLARLEEEPKQFLQGNGLKLQVLEGVEDYYISDIGFIDGALHIKFINHGENIYSTRLSHAEEHVWSDYNRRYSEVDALGNEVEVNYEVYPIKNIAELKNYELQINAEEVGLAIDEQFTFEVQTKLAAGTTKTIDKKVQLSDAKQGVLKSIIYTPLSLACVIEGSEISTYDDEALTVILKDGRQQRIYVDSAEYSKDKVTFMYDIATLEKEIAKIVLGNTEIVNFK